MYGLTGILHPMCQYLEEMALEKKPIFLMGDFHVDLLRTDFDKESDVFLLHNLSFCLKPFIIRPTRVTHIVRH